jgi:A/G-specific adenine glycosylase
MMTNEQFRSHLFEWAATHPRPLPWKGEADPYKIWLSEVLLQQTRVEQGMPYYLRFIEAYPNIHALAAAPEGDVLKLWEGLGYYSRARNLHAAAKHVAFTLNGVFPSNLAGLQALPGVGAYTAAAIASFAYQQPHAVLDGNVYRVLARIWGYDEPVDRPEAKVWFAKKAQALLDVDRAGQYNQAIMDFGATWCTPKRPRCANCPMAEQCAAAQQQRTAEWPRKTKRPEKRRRIFLYAVVQQGEMLYMRERTDKDIWQNLWEFPLLEVEETPAENARIGPLLVDHFFKKSEQKNVKIDMVQGPIKQVLTHQKVYGFFVKITQNDPYWRPDASLNWRATEQFTLKKMLAKPRLIDRFLDENPLSLTLF